MKNVFKKALIVGGLLSAVATQAVAGSLQLNLDRVQPKLGHKVPAVAAGVLRVNCPNPMIRDIHVRLLARSSSQARLLITAVVENAGGADYRSNPGQQLITLKRDNQRLRSRNFTVIRAGERIQLTYPLIVSAHGYGEFTPTFHAYLTYDPDVRTDGNPANDDCRGTDNRKSLSGNAVNALLN